MSDEPDLSAVRTSLGDALLDLQPVSIYQWAPVFRCRVRGHDGQPVEAVLKRTVSSPGGAHGIVRWTRELVDRGVRVVAPVAMSGAEPPIADDDGHWTVYPWIDGREADGSLADLVAAGDLLGRLHAGSTDLVDTGIPELEWPEYDQESVAEDVEGITQVCVEQGIPAEVAARWKDELETFWDSTLPAIRDAGLPAHPVSLDHRAVNLLYPENQSPVMVDPDNADSAPRLLDLAVSVLLFASEASANPGRLFDAAEWSAFYGAYRAHVDLTPAERELWPTALRYMRLEWGCWQLTEGAEWDLPGQRPYLLDLLTMNDERYPLTA